METQTKLVFPFLLVIFVEIETTTKFVPDEKKLRDHLVSNGCWPLDPNYASIRPVLDPNNSVNVIVGAIFDRVLEMSDPEEKISVIVNFQFFWNIPCVKWDGNSSWSHIDLLTIPTKEVWIPKVSHAKCVENYFLDQSPKSIDSVHIYPNGNANWWACGVFETHCDFHFELFPFDTQTCEIALEAWDYPKQVQLRFDHSTLVEPRNTGAKDFYFPDESNRVKVYEDTNNHNGYNSDRVVFQLKMKRDPTYYTSVIIVPTLSLTILQNFAFFLPISIDRCSFLVTILLAISVIQSVVDINIPHVAQKVVMSYFLLGFTMLATFATVYSIAILHMVNSNKQLKKKLIFRGKIKLISFVDTLSFCLFSLATLFFLLVIFYFLLLK